MQTFQNFFAQKHRAARHTANFLLTREWLNLDLPGHGRAIERAYYGLLRPKELEALGLYTTAYGYDQAGRLDRVWDQPTLDGNHDPVGAASFNYTYLNRSGNLLRRTQGPNFNVWRTYDATRNNLETMTNQQAFSPYRWVSRFQYRAAHGMPGLNGLGQRESVTNEGFAFSSTTRRRYQYNQRGEVVSNRVQERSAQGNWFEIDGESYRYDAIGNREAASDQAVLPANPKVSYQANLQNQYTSITTNGSTFSPSHDADGNSLQTLVPGHFTAALGSQVTATNLQWDAENRLVAITTARNGTVSYQYDYLGRRIRRNLAGSILTYLYDGWNNLTLHHYGGLLRSYTWGLDLSGTMQGVGGVGGMLAVRKGSGSNAQTHYPLYDRVTDEGNGNVSDYLDQNGALSAHYEYDAFGRTTKANGPQRNEFRYRFSTKPMDYIMGLYYYGYRWYSPVTGRWISRDPITEEGGIHIYSLLNNSPISTTDHLGLLNNEKPPMRTVLEGYRCKVTVTIEFECQATKIKSEIEGPCPRKGKVTGSGTHSGKDKRAAIAEALGKAINDLNGQGMPCKVSCCALKKWRRLPPKDKCSESFKQVPIQPMPPMGVPPNFNE